MQRRDDIGDFLERCPRAVKMRRNGIQCTKVKELAFIRCTHNLFIAYQ